MRKLFILVTLITLTVTPAQARSWADLYEDDKDYFGREREEKFPVRLFLIERESWEEHSSWHFFFFLGQTSYPRYSRFYLFPFYYDLSSKIDTRNLTITPFHYSRTGPGESDFALFPLYYSGYEDYSFSEACDTLADPACRPLERKVTESYRTVIPFFHWSGDGTSSTLYTPLFISSYHKKDKSLLNWFWVYFHHEYDSGKSEDIWWFPVVPLFFRYANTETNDASFWLTPLLLYKYSSAKGDLNWFIFPLYYYDREAGHQATHYSPLYIDTRNDGNGFWGLLPLFLQYSDENLRLHVNITGLSVSRETIMLALENNPNGDYVLDTDFAWLYSALRLSFRVPVAQMVGAESAEQRADAPVETKPAIADKLSVKRSESHSFFGYYFLFGISAYERADDSRHFRLLPLSWFTWKKNSENAMYVVPPLYVWYNTPLLRYKVFFPVYGSQFRVEDEKVKYLESWFLFAYLREKDESQSRYEVSVLWPVYNAYFLPNEEGYRIFPVWWYKRYIRESGISILSFSPVHYFEKSEYTSLFLSPFYIRSESSVSETTSILLGYLRHRRTDNTYHNFMLFPWYMSDSANGSSTRMLMPVYASFISPGSLSLFIFPHYHFSSEGRRRENLLWLADYESIKSDESVRLSLLLRSLHWEKSADTKKVTILYGLGGSYYRHSDGYEWSLAFLVGSEVNQTYRHHRFMPFWWYTSIDHNTHYSDLWLPALFSARFRNEYRDSDWVALGLLAYRSNYHGQHEGMFHLLAGSLYYSRREPERTYSSSGSLWGLLWHYEEEPGYKRFIVLKFLYSRTEKDGIIKNKILGIPAW